MATTFVKLWKQLVPMYLNWRQSLSRLLYICHQTLLYSHNASLDKFQFNFHLTLALVNAIVTSVGSIFVQVPHTYSSTKEKICEATCANVYEQKHKVEVGHHTFAISQLLQHAHNAPLGQVVAQFEFNSSPSKCIKSKICEGHLCQCILIERQG